MVESQYINEDGSVKAEILAMQQGMLASSCARHGVDPAFIQSLLEQVNRDGYVILRDQISPDVVQLIRKESAPFLTHDGRTEFEGHKTRRTRRA